MYIPYRGSTSNPTLSQNYWEISNCGTAGKIFDYLSNKTTNDYYSKKIIREIVHVYVANRLLHTNYKFVYCRRNKDYNNRNCRFLHLPTSDLILKCCDLA